MIHHPAFAIPIIVGVIVAIAMSFLGASYARKRPNA